MCYQAFVHYACGHDEIIATACPIGEGITYFVKHACPNYQSESKYPIALCGIGKFYCGKMEVDGAFLDGVHGALKRFEADLQHVDWSLAVMKQKAMQFTRVANQYNIAKEVRPRHAAYGKILSQNNKLVQRRTMVLADLKKVIHIISEAVDYFQRKQLLTGQVDLFIQPAFVTSDVNCRLPMELMPLEPLPTLPPGIPIVPQYVAPTELAINAGQGNQLTHQTTALLPPSEGDEIQVTHIRRYHSGNPGAAEKNATPALTPQKAALTGTINAPTGSGFKDGAAKRLTKQTSKTATRRSRKQATSEKPPELPTDDSSNIRRSTRVRKQKVSYAESQGSDISRDTSPDKYEESPEKSISDFSEEPEPVSRRAGKEGRKAQRGGTGPGQGNSDTLASKIGDWKRRSGNANDETSGKSASQRGMETAGGRASGQQRVQQGPEATSASNSLWKAPPSAHSRVLMQGAPPTAAGSQSMFGFGSTASTNPYTNAMGGALGRPFPDTTDLPAVVGPNIFNSYMQQSLPGVNARTQSAQSWSMQQGAQYPMQQPAFGQQSQSVMGSGNITPLPNYQDWSGFSTGLPDTTSASSQSQQHSMASNLPAIGSNFTSQAGFSTGANCYNGGYNYDMTSGLQTPAETPADNRADSVTQASEYPNIDFATYFDYDRLRQSFGAGTDLSPDKTPITNVIDTEPKKRALPASSPTPMAKRVRLSLPGGGDATTVSENNMSYGVEADTGAVTSSPAKMSTQQRQPTVYGPPFEGTVHNSSPTPAPIMAPTAIMFPQTQSTSAANNLEDAVELPSMGEESRVVEQGGEGDVFEGGAGESVADMGFDWSFMNEEIAFGDE